MIGASSMPFCDMTSVKFTLQFGLTGCVCLFAVGSGGAVKRLGSVSMGAGIAGLVGFPVGLLQQYVATKANPLKPQKPIQSVPKETEVPYRKNGSDLVGELVNQLESSLQKPSDQPDSSETTP